MDLFALLDRRQPKPRACNGLPEAWLSIFQSYVYVGAPLRAEDIARSKRKGGEKWVVFLFLGEFACFCRVFLFLSFLGAVGGLDMFSLFVPLLLKGQTGML